MSDTQVIPYQASGLPDNFSVCRAPALVLKEAQEAAKALQQVLSAKPKKVVINGEQYLEFEDWLTVGRFYGVTVKVASTQFVEFDGVRGWEATADVLLVATNQVVSSAQSMCLNDEERWGNRPLFQLRSMAQTRACAKALRNVLAWVVVLAGYRPTPAEEMPGEGETGKAMPQRKGENGGDGNRISEAQRKRMYAIGKNSGYWTDDAMRKLLRANGFERSEEVTKDKYEALCATLGQPPAEQQETLI